MKALILLVPIFLVSTLYAQDKNSNAISLNLFKLESNQTTINHSLEPKLVSGITYERYLRSWSWLTKVEYGKNAIDDHCNSCADVLMGTGSLKEFNVLTGIAYTTNRLGDSKLKWSFETDLYFSYMNYSGVFTGGWSGGFSALDMNYYVGGLQLLSGLHYYFLSYIRLTLSVYGRFGIGKAENSILNKTFDQGDLSLALPQIQIGFEF